MRRPSPDDLDRYRILIRMLPDRVYYLGHCLGLAFHKISQPRPKASHTLRMRRGTTRVIKRFCRFLRGLGLDSYEECNTPDGTQIKPQDVFFFLLLNGLDKTPWTTVYRAIILFLNLGVVKSTTAGPCGFQPLHFIIARDWSANLSEGIIEILVLLLKYNADPCALTDGGHPVLLYAQEFGWVDEFSSALSRCHVDIRDVASESLRRTLHFKHFTATSTAVEEDMIDGPSLKGLSRRTPLLGDRLDH